MMMNNEKYYVVFYDNIQLINDDQNKYKMSRIVSKVVDFERETKISFDDRVSHNMKIFINKKNVIVFASRKKVFNSMKKKSNRFFKKKKTSFKSFSTKIDNNFFKSRNFFRNIENCYERRVI